MIIAIYFSQEKDRFVSNGPSRILFLHRNHLQGFVQFVIKLLLHGNGFDNVHFDNLIITDTDYAVTDAVFELAHRFVTKLRR